MYEFDAQQKSKASTYTHRATDLQSDESSDGETFLLYGFDNVRSSVLEALKKKHPRKRFVKIDDLNFHLDITLKALSDFPRLIQRINNFGALNSVQRTVYFEAAQALSAETGLKVERSFDLLQSWREFLQKKYGKLTPLALYGASKVNDPKQAIERLYRLVNKNVPGQIKTKKMEFTAIKALASIINEEDAEARNKLLRENMQKFANVGMSIGNAFFRKTSKLGLEWAEENNIGVVFIESALDETVSDEHQTSGAQQENKFVAIPPEVVSDTRTKAYAQGERVKSYEPITFSEMRHYRRRGMRNVQAIHVDNNA